MSTETYTVPLTNRHRLPADSSVFRLEEVPSTAAAAASLPPVSRKTQATVLISAFLTIALTIGYNSCYGIFQEYYLSPSQDILSQAPASESSPPTALLAFIGTLAAGLTWSGSIVVNPLISRIEHSSSSAPSSPGGNKWQRLYRRLHTPRVVTILGVFLMSLGFLLASLSTSIWHLVLTQGLLYGLGSSMFYFPVLSPAPEYFTAHRATALGFILAGAGVGGLILSPAIRALLSAVGGRWTLRTLALFMLVVGTPVAWAVPRSRFPSTPSSAVSGDDNGTSSSDSPAGRDVERRRTHIPTHLAGKPIFLFSALLAFLQSAGAQLPLSFIPSYTVSLGLSSSQGATLLAVSSAVNAVSRVATGYAGDRLGRQNTLILTIVVAMSSVFAFWLQSVRWTSEALWYGFIVVYSAAAGGYYALFPATIAELFGIRQYAAVNGFLYFIRGLGTMFGSPVGGQLLDRSGDGGGHGAGLSPTAAFAKIVYWDGALLLGASFCVVGVRWADAQGKGWRFVA